MHSLLCLAKLKASAAFNHRFSVIDKAFYHILQVKQLRLAINQGNVVDRERRLQLRVLIELVEYHIAHCISLELIDNSHSVFVTLVFNSRNSLNLLFFHQCSLMFYHVGFDNLVRHRGNHYLLCIGMLVLLNVSRTSYDNLTSSGMESTPHSVISVNHSSGRKIRCLDVVH